MGKIHVGQTALDIIRTLGVDITGNSEILLKFLKPSLKAGEWTATSSGTDLLTGILTYSIATVDDLDEYGTWIIWGKVTFADGTIAESEATTLFVHKAGQL